MSERDELRERLGRWLFEHDGEGGTRSWEAIGSGAQEAMRSGADAILQEIERTHVLVSVGHVLSIDLTSIPEAERSFVMVPREVADMVTVERAVLVTLLARLASYADEYPGDDAMTYYRMANEVESGARDRLTAAEWREIGGGD